MNIRRKGYIGDMKKNDIDIIEDDIFENDELDVEYEDEFEDDEFDEAFEDDEFDEEYEDDTFDDNEFDDEEDEDDDDAYEESLRKNKLKIIFGVIAGVVLLVISSGIYYFSENKVEPLQERVVIEFGEAAPTRIRDYFTYGRFVNIEEAIFDISNILINKEGVYEATLTINNKITSARVAVVDTIEPSISLLISEDGFRGFVGEEIKMSEIIESVDDMAGIESVVIRDNQVEKQETRLDENNIPDTSIKYDEIGEYENVIVATDNNGLVTEKTIIIIITDDYSSHIQGLQDFTIEAGEDVDFMQDITFDEMIQEITVDSSSVNTDVEGEYVITYTIVLQNGTIVTKEQKVTVVSNADSTSTNFRQNESTTTRQPASLDTNNANRTPAGGNTNNTNRTPTGGNTNNNSNSSTPPSNNASSPSNNTNTNSNNNSNTNNNNTNNNTNNNNTNNNSNNDTPPENPSGNDNSNPAPDIEVPNIPEDSAPNNDSNDEHATP